MNSFEPRNAVQAALMKNTHVAMQWRRNTGKTRYMITTQLQSIALEFLKNPNAKIEVASLNKWHFNIMRDIAKAVGITLEMNVAKQKDKYDIYRATVIKCEPSNEQ